MLRTTSGRQLKGWLVAYDASCFHFRDEKALWTTDVERLRWDGLKAREVFAIHEQLLVGGPAAGWRRLSRLLATLPDGKPYAQAASRLAAELDSSLAPDARQRQTDQGKPPSRGMVSVLERRPPRGPKARRLIKALKQHWGRMQRGAQEAKGRSRDTHKQAEERPAVRLPRPVLVRATTATGERVTGRVVSYHQRGFELRAGDGQTRQRRWAEFTAEAVFRIHETLLADATPQQWLELGKLLWTFPGGIDLADTAFGIALERGPALGEEQVFNRIHLLAYIHERRGRVCRRPPATTDEAPYWIRMREQLAMARKDRKQLYRVAGEHLLLADRLLASRDRKKRLRGVGYAHDVAYVAIQRLSDPLLALAIADFYLLPNLRHADRRPTQLLSQTAILNTAIAAYHKAGDLPRQVRALERLIPLARTRHAADAARYRLAHCLAAGDQCERALYYLNQMARAGGASGEALRRKLEATVRQKRRNRSGDTPGKGGE